MRYAVSFIHPPLSAPTNPIFNAQEFIVDIDGIQAHGIGAADITKLKANGYYTVAVSYHFFRPN